MEIYNIQYIVGKYKIHLYSLANRPEKLAEGSLLCLFLKLVQINFIFTDNVRILYISMIIKTYCFFTSKYSFTKIVVQIFTYAC